MADTRAFERQRCDFTRVEQRRRNARETPRDQEEAVSQLSDLLSDEPQRVLGALIDPSLSPHFASYVIEFLANDTHAQSKGC